MTRRKPALAMASVAALALTGCAVSNQNTATPSAETTTSPPPASAFGAEAPVPPPSTDRIPPVGARWLEIDEVDGLGTIVVDGKGRTVYASSADTGGRPTCYDACADTWLPLLASGNPSGGIGIQVSQVTTATRRDGAEQATYQGHPLYWYAGDGMPGEINGHGVELFGAEWFVLTPDGDRATVG
ncbi:hypothetical protein [Mycolicibacterium sp. S3B2]|uniref:COG4315 family predicted lipoprotein n=1 Tax=Mycolicibacterium sp. S3B2 TaxID=3415120 RepID=UPI003C7B9421